MKKRIFPLLLALAMVLGLAACGNGKSNESQTPGPDGTADADGIKFAIMFGVGGLAGMYLAARLQKYLPARPIRILLALIVLGTAGAWLAPGLRASIG